MMKEIMPFLNNKSVGMAEYPDFNNNQMLAPKKNISGIAAFSKNKLTQAAMALSMKAVQSDPQNVNAQNNMAAMLTQYGYAEQAMPVLEKLKNEFFNNSTVLNNVGQAWFSLGQLNSAKNLFQ